MKQLIECLAIKVSVETDVIRIGDKRYYIKGGSEIGFSASYMHRRESEWGPDAAMYATISIASLLY